VIFVGTVFAGRAPHLHKTWNRFFGLAPSDLVAVPGSPALRYGSQISDDQRLKPSAFSAKAESVQLEKAATTAREELKKISRPHGLAGTTQMVTGIDNRNANPQRI